jgi:oxygen-independent coproporphyrinogen III oxidase
MAGVYIHIPFCRQACHYCDFHFSTSLKSKSNLLKALKKELVLRKQYLQSNRIHTVYFGGGSPSLLSQSEIMELFDELSKHFVIEPGAEITLEANPDDLSQKKLRALSQTPINRLSIGIQSFRDADLRFLNRIHTAKHAVESVENARAAGFENISLDLIYGIQTLSNSDWIGNIEKAISLQATHISCYALTVEPKTALHSFIQKRKTPDVDPQKVADQFDAVMNKLAKNDFSQYEISNFCKKGFQSKHNSNYWKGEKYLGIGPSAHSYDGTSRQWNVKNNPAYVRSLEKNIIPYDKEELSEVQLYNEYILTSLRTAWGVSLAVLKKSFREKFYLHFKKEAESFIIQKMLVQNKDTVLLTHKGKFFADRIAGNIFYAS